MTINGSDAGLCSDYATSGLVLIQLISGSNLPCLACVCVGVSVNVELLNLFIT